MKMKTFFCLAVLCLAISPVMGEDKSADIKAVTKRVSVEEFDQLRSGTNVVLLDVRTKAEFEKGRIPGAKNLDVNSPRFAEHLAALDKSKTYLVNCEVGMRSARACKKMDALGFTTVYELTSGFDAWRKARKPIEK